MRFRRLRSVSIAIIIVVLSACVCVALVRKFVFPAPPGEQHSSVDLSLTEAMTFESLIWENHKDRTIFGRTGA